LTDLAVGLSSEKLSACQVEVRERREVRDEKAIKALYAEGEW
jgi:hypothetical protein